MYFIKLTTTITKKPVYIDASKIEVIRRGTNETLVSLQSAITIAVNETPSEIFEIIYLTTDAELRKQMLTKGEK
tara:strand:- start:389 stop:610 length:222 start_codon:yes stop_codon:yes gene_type:complete